MKTHEMKRFDITYFHGPFGEYIVKESVVRDIAESGITLVPLQFHGTEVNKEALRVLAKYGLRADVSDPRVRDVIYRRDYSAVDSVVREVVEDYREFDNIEGWELVDEPNSSAFPILATVVNAFRRYSPDKECVINLFPKYASPEQLGNPDYMTHLEEYVNVVRPQFISYDHYHFIGRENRKEAELDTADERENAIRVAAESCGSIFDSIEDLKELAVKNGVDPELIKEEEFVVKERYGFFDNIEEVREVAMKYGIDPMLIVLLTEHGPYRNLTRAELKWEVNMCLAYGMKRISYFTYWLPSYSEFWQWDNAMCGLTGEKYPHYYDVKAINEEILPIGRYIFDKESAAVFHIGESEEKTTQFSSYGGITAIDGDGGVVGFFSDGSFYLVNRSYTSENTFKIHSEGTLTVMKNGIFTDLDGDTVTLGAGEAVLLKR